MVDGRQQLLITNGLIRHYDKLTPWERVPLLFAAEARRDEAELAHLYASAPRKCFEVCDHADLINGLFKLADVQMMRQLDLTAWFWQVTAMQAEQVWLQDDPESDPQEEKLGFLTRPKFPTIKVPKKKPQPIPAEAFEKLLNKAPDALWRAFLLCGWWAGLHLSEARRLQWDTSDSLPWVDFEGSRIVLPAVFAKSAQDQWVPLHPVLRQALAELPRTDQKVFPFKSRKGGGPLSLNGITNRILEMAKQAGVKLSMHRLRKGFGCRVAKQLGKGNAPVLHELMRHSSMQITMDYYANVDEAKQAAISALV